jgi:hypothetical protein
MTSSIVPVRWPWSAPTVVVPNTSYADSTMAKNVTSTHNKTNAYVGRFKKWWSDLDQNDQSRKLKIVRTLLYAWINENDKDNAPDTDNYQLRKYRDSVNHWLEFNGTPEPHELLNMIYLLRDYSTLDTEPLSEFYFLE